MKLLDKAFDRAVELAKPVQALTNALKDVALHLHDIGEHLVTLTYNQSVHHQMIKQMWVTQQAIVKRLYDSSLDVSMPEPRFQEEDDQTKKKASQKPN